MENKTLISKEDFIKGIEKVCDTDYIKERSGVDSDEVQTVALSGLVIVSLLQQELFEKTTNTRVDNANSIQEEVVIFNEWCEKNKRNPKDSRSLAIFIHEHREVTTNTSQIYYNELLNEIIRCVPYGSLQTTISLLDALINSLR